jgi:RNA polymerase sigma-70 factor (ECF subfamily)
MTPLKPHCAPSTSVTVGDARASTASVAPASVTRLSDTATATDADLVRAALRGDAAAAPAIWIRYIPVVRRRLSAHFDGAELEDHVQEVFARCFEQLPRLRDHAALRSFLIGITLRVALLECRRRRFRSWAAVTLTGELPDAAVSDDMELRLLVSRIRELLGRLKPDSCHLLELRFVRGHELSEVADTMGVSLATAKRHLARASAHVRLLAQSEPVVAEYVRDGFVRGSGRASGSSGSAKVRSEATNGLLGRKNVV